MPSTSGPQHRLMEMVAHDPGAAKRVGIPQSVGKDFAKADEGKKFSASKEKAKVKALRKQPAESAGAAQGSGAVGSAGM